MVYGTFDFRSDSEEPDAGRRLLGLHDHDEPEPPNRSDKCSMPALHVAAQTADELDNNPNPLAGVELVEPPAYLVEIMKRRWRRPDKPGPEYAWCENNVQGRIDAWTTLVTVAGFLGAFALNDFAGLESAEDGASLFKSYKLAVHAFGLAIATGTLLLATVILSAVLWNVAREMSSDHYFFSHKSDPDVRAAIGDHFEVGYGAWCVLKTFTENTGESSAVPFGLDIVNVSGKAVLVGIFSYITAVCAKVLSSVDELWVSVPCAAFVLGTALFSVVCTARMGVELS